MHSLTLSASATIEAAASDGAPARPVVSALAYTGGAVRVGNYPKPMVVDLDGLDISKNVPLLYAHNRDAIVGQGKAERKGNQLQLTGQLSGKSEEKQRILDLAGDGFEWSVSVGVMPTNIQDIRAGQTVEVNGQQFTGPVGVVRAGYLYETSFVSVGADRFASATIAASLSNKGQKMEFSQWLGGKGFVEAELSQEQLKPLQAAFEAEHKGSSSVDAVLQAARDKEARQASYSRIIASAIDRGMDTDTAERLVAAATNDNLSETQFELQVLRATRHEGSSRAPSSHSNISGDVIEAAVARSIGSPDLESVFRPEVLEASERQFKHGLSLVELMMLSARRNGHRDISHRDTRALLQAAFAPVQAASGASTYDLGGVLSNVANKMIRAGFTSVEQEWRKVSAITPVNDLKEMKSYSLTGDFSYQEVGKGGELKHATMGEEEYSNRAKTYGRLFALTRTDIINDDLGAFNRVRTLLGRGAALSFNKIFWTEFLKEVATFYTTGRGNYFEGASSALDVDSLSTGFTTFESQTDPDGNPLGLSPGVLIVPTALKIAANRLANDPEIRVNGAQAKTTYTTSNPHAGKVEVAASTYLNNANVPNGSATHWFLAANPMDMPLIETVFLYGRQEPFIESADADFDTLGVQMRGYHDFGVAKQEYRAGVRSKGAA